MQFLKTVCWSWVSICAVTGPLLAETLRSGIDAKGFDPSVRIQDDLFLHVNGEWLKHTQIPDDKSNYGSFTILSDEALVKQREIIEECAAGTFPAGSDRQKVGDFYQSFMNETLVNERGIDPLRDVLGQIEQLESVPAVIKFFGTLQAKGIGGAIGFYVDQDDKNSTQYLAAIVQSGTTLPDRDYYLTDEQKYLDARQALRAYIIKLYGLCNFADGEAAADAILKLETRLAEVQWERTELRNAEKRYNKQTVAKLIEGQPGIPWRDFLSEAGAGDVQEINVVTPSFFVGLEKIVADTPLEVWKHYLRFNLIDSAAPYLPAAFVDAHFDLHSKELAGVPAQQPRWKRAVETTAGAGAGDFGVLGDSVGRLFVERHFTPAAKQRMDELVKNLLKAYQVSINELAWMTPDTKQRAQDKLQKITTKIGYTTKWRDYTALEIKRDDLLGNLLRSNHVEHQRMLDKLGKPVDKAE